jgi:hypothetical protein
VRHALGVFEACATQRGVAGVVGFARSHGRTRSERRLLV